MVSLSTLKQSGTAVSDNRVAKIKDLVEFLGQFDPETDLVFENLQWGNEPVLVSDFVHKQTWTSSAQYQRTTAGKEFISTSPCFLL